MRAVWLLCLCQGWGWASAAFAADTASAIPADIPTELPAGSEPGAWRTALALSGLQRAAVGDGPGVRLIERAESLLIWVRDVHGAEHELTVPLPQTPQEREAVTALAASLVQPMAGSGLTLPVLPSLPAPRAQVRASSPVPRSPRAPSEPPAPASEPPAVAVAAVPEPVLIERPGLVRFDPLRSGEPEPIEPAPEAGPAVLALSRPEYTFWAVGLSLRMRPTVRSMAAVGGLVGRRWGPWSLAVGMEAVLPALLLQVEGTRRLAVLDLRLLPSVSFAHWDLGPVVGFSGRRVIDPVRSPPPALIPTAGLALSRSQSVGSAAVRFSLLVEVDAVASDIELGSVTTRLQPISAGLSTTVAGRR